MINDYAGFCTTIGVNKLHHLSGRATARNSLTVPASGLLRKTASVLVAVSLILGLSSTLWCSMRIDETLNAIGQTRATWQELTVVQHELTAQRNNLKTPENIRATAAALGLFPPGNRQIRTP
jgi:hypothetical protein